MEATEEMESEPEKAGQLGGPGFVRLGNRVVIVPPRRVPTATLGGRAGISRGPSGPELHWGHSVKDLVRQLTTEVRCASATLPWFFLCSS